VTKIHAMTKEDLVEDLRAVYGDETADEIAESRAVTFVEVFVVDHQGHEHLLDPIATIK
jgi:hypothetical protein